MSEVFRDARYALRFLVRNPGFALSAILTVAVGLGPTTAVFSIVNAVLMRPLPHKDSQQLVQVIERVDERNAPTGVRMRAGGRSGALRS